MTDSTLTILIAFDGTWRARRALEQAARFLRPGAVELITAWEPVTRQTARALGRTGLPQTTVELEYDDHDAAQTHARAALEEGVTLAGDLGIKARAHLVETSGTTAQAIIDAAKELDVDVIVVGTRGLSGVRSWFNTSTAEQLMQNGGLPVFVVPPAEDEEQPEDGDDHDTPLSAF
ncbi:universal stress protein [Corynebacterium yudongzhengii]|uniref:Universal stress protein n=1 Tax=Corynebacterium yudongzhengii TaxID=2080740 RepID=A0A2U1T848_9CORY|nr:universal stress protein [Corynebacterium yudongzhengii]AWB82759.1 universal stress protein [Corynebacterium yudongzhengii]PWC02181.1 universal stress protein [Corynebacterium yudongzhengii]